MSKGAHRAQLKGTGKDSDRRELAGRGRLQCFKRGGPHEISGETLGPEKIEKVPKAYLEKERGGRSTGGVGGRVVLSLEKRKKKASVKTLTRRGGEEKRGSSGTCRKS